MVIQGRRKKQEGLGSPAFGGSMGEEQRLTDGIYEEMQIGMMEPGTEDTSPGTPGHGQRPWLVQTSCCSLCPFR